MEKKIRDQRKAIASILFTSCVYFLKVKFGGGITDARGSLAGNVFSRNHFGAYVRARTTPINPRTARQTLVRSSVAFLADRWANTLTAVQRTAWELYASSVAMTDSLGASMYLTGYNHYIRSNIILVMSTLPPVDNGPVIFEIPAHDPTFAISASEATQQISYTFDNTLAWANEDDAYLFKFQGKPQNAQRNSFGGPWRIVGNVAGDSVTAPTSPDAEDSPFAFAEGQHQWCYARIAMADGRLSAPFRADTFCLA